MTEPFRMSPHAIDRALEMGVTGEEIRACYDKPDESYWSQTHEKWCYKRGRIALGITPDRNTIATVLWRTQRDWRADYARGGDLTGRERRTRTDMNHLPRRRA